jgi:hypothetical protein
MDPLELGAGGVTRLHRDERVAETALHQSALHRCESGGPLGVTGTRGVLGKDRITRDQQHPRRVPAG